jgi:hypothetical protein
MSHPQRIPYGVWPSPIKAVGDRSWGFGVREGARGARSKTRPPALERGREPLVADGTYLGPVKAGRHLDDRAVNASA